MNDELDIAAQMRTMGIAARAAAVDLAGIDSGRRHLALRHSAVALRARVSSIVEANKQDVTAAKAKNLSAAIIDRLMLDPERIEAMALAIEAIVAMPDPVGKILAEWERPNGLRIQRVAVPLGVIGIIYESRPNVTADAAALCLKSGNAVILRGGSESFESSKAIFACMQEGLRHAEIDVNCVQMVPTRDRAAVGFLLSSMSEWVDVIVPRGGKSLIQRVQDEARVPVIGHLEGICHVFLHSSADIEIAKNIAVNAKMRRTGICGAAETLLVDRSASPKMLHTVCTALLEAGCELRGDADVLAAVPEALAAVEEDWSTEYLDSIVSIRIVDGVDAAVAHIRQYGSGHTESIVASDIEAAEKFLNLVDSAIVLHNASTQFADGGEFGMGAEIGIATGRVHARGPVGANQLMSYKYVVRGSGQVRP